MIECSDLHHAYDEQSALSGVSLSAPPGSVLAVMGANGAGKTTLLRILAGLIEPDAGSVACDGTVGFAPENPADALFAASVAEELAFFPRNRGLDVDAHVEHALEAMALGGYRERAPHSLSTGEQRRVAIAAVLAGDPAVVALDEPTAGLDRRAERKLGRLLASLDASVVLSTHESDLAYEYADRVALLADGELLAEGPPAGVLTDERRLRAAEVRTPGLVAWAREAGVDPPPATVEEAVATARGRR